jgi:hypothetical protein
MYAAWELQDNALATLWTKRYNSKKRGENNYRAEKVERNKRRTLTTTPQRKQNSTRARTQRRKQVGTHKRNSKKTTVSGNIVLIKLWIFSKEKLTCKFDISKVQTQS